MTSLKALILKLFPTQDLQRELDTRQDRVRIQQIGDVKIVETGAVVSANVD